MRRHRGRGTLAGSVVLYATVSYRLEARTLSGCGPDEQTTPPAANPGGSTNVAFADLVNPAEGFGFRLARTRGSHHMFSHPAAPGLLNLQSVRGQAKPYQ